MFDQGESAPLVGEEMTTQSDAPDVHVNAGKFARDNGIVNVNSKKRIY